MPNNQLFYDSGAGDALADETALPNPILGYVHLETAIVKQVLNNFDALIEVGCMWGRLGNLALETNKPYLGIDVSPRYINLAKRRFGSSKLCSLVCCDATDPSCSAIKIFNQSWKPTRPILVLPFNCIGNMDCPKSMIDQIERWQMDTLIFGYQDGPSQVRLLAEYFSKSGVGATNYSRGKKEISFNSSSGFQSLLLRKSWFTAHWENSHCLDIGEMLRCWTNFDVALPRIESIV